MVDLEEFLDDSLQVDAFLADSVDSVNGKLYAHGAGWNIIRTKSMPARHPRIGIGALIRVPYTATNQPHELEIRLEDGNGNVVQMGPPSSEGQAPAPVFKTGFSVGRPPRLVPGEEQVVPISLNLDGMIFQKPDSYRFVLLIDGEVAKTLSLRVTLDAPAS